MPVSFVILSLFLSGIVYLAAWLAVSFAAGFDIIAFSGVFSYAVFAAGWLAGLVITAIMVVRGGRRPERLTLFALCLMLVSALLSFPVAYPLIKTWLFYDGGNGYAASYITDVLGAYGYLNLLGGWLGLAGIICLIRAVWMKWREV